MNQGLLFPIALEPPKTKPSRQIERAHLIIRAIKQLYKISPIERATRVTSLLDLIKQYESEYDLNG